MARGGRPGRADGDFVLPGGMPPREGTAPTARGEDARIPRSSARNRTRQRTWRSSQASVPDELRPKTSSSRRGSAATDAHLVGAWDVEAGHASPGAAAALGSPAPGPAGPGRAACRGPARGAAPPELTNVEPRQLLEPAGEGVVGRERREVAEDRRVRHRADVGRVAVVGQGPRLRRRAPLDEPPGIV